MWCRDVAFAICSDEEECFSDRLVDYLTVRFSYRHSLHPNYHQNTVPIGISRYAIRTTMEARACINVSQFSDLTGGTWSSDDEPATTAKDHLIPFVRNYWTTDQAMSVIDVINKSQPLSVESESSSASSVPSRSNTKLSQRSVSSTITTDGTRELDPARKVWKDMRKASGGFTRIVSFTKQRHVSREQRKASGNCNAVLEEEPVEKKTKKEPKKQEKQEVTAEKAGCAKTGFTGGGLLSYFFPSTSD